MQYSECLAGCRRQNCVAIQNCIATERLGSWAGRWARLLGVRRRGRAGACARARRNGAGERRASGRRTRRAGEQQARGARGAWQGAATDAGARDLGVAGRAGWPRLCTRCTRLDFQTGFRLSIFPESVNDIVHSKIKFFRKKKLYLLNSNKIK